MSDPMRIRAIEKDGVIDVKILMKHDMESGQRLDAFGKTIPAWHITNVTARLKDKVIFSAQFGPAVSKDPLLNFKFRGAEKGDEIMVNWFDNHGDQRIDKAKII